MRRDLPIPERLIALDVLKINLDQLLSPPVVRKVWATFTENIPYVVQYMRDLGYEISDPNLPEASIKELVKGSEPQEALVKWFREESRRKRGEPLTHYINRCAHLYARLLAVFSYITGELII